MTVPKIPADGFTVFTGSFGFAIGVQQAEFPSSPVEGPQNVSMTTMQEIRISPFIAKVLMQSLAMNLRRYEEQFGEIAGGPALPGRTN